MHTRLDSDDRGVSEVVGAILVFGILVTLLGIIQAQAVPDQNREVEIQHTAQVQEDLIKFHEVASAVAAGGDEQSVAVQSGTGYPSRLLFFNPPRVQGAVSTTGSQTVEIRNIKASGETDDYFTDDAGNDLDLSTRRIEYNAGYNELQDDPTIRYEYGVLYSNYSDGTTIQNEGSVVDGNDINLIFTAGDYNRTSSTSQSLAVRPVSAPSRSVTVDNVSGAGNNITLVLPSELPESEWQELYASSDSVVNIDKPSPDTVEIELDGSKQYNLRTSQIALGTDVPEEDGYYIVPSAPNSTSVAQGGTANVRYEVRDRYNNPVSNVTVEGDKPNPSGPNPVERTTNADGQITVPVQPGDAGTQFATAFIKDQSNVDGCTGNNNPADKSERCQADFTLQVTDLSINPNSGVRLTDAEVKEEEFNAPETDISVPAPLDSEVANVTFKGGDRNIKSIRMNVYLPADGGSPPTQAVMNDTDPVEFAISPMEVGGPFYDSTRSEWKDDGPGDPGPEEITPDGTSYKFGFFDDSGNAREINDGDLFVLTIVYQNDERAVYFVSPRDP